MVGLKVVLKRTYRDTNGCNMIVIRILNRSTMAYISTGISIEERYFVSDARNGSWVKGCRNAGYINEVLMGMYVEYYDKMRAIEGIDGMTAKEIKGRLERKKVVRVCVGEFFKRHMEGMSDGNRLIYMTTYKMLCRYCEIDAMSFEALDVEWLQGYDRWMEQNGYSVNYRAMNMRNLRAVVNGAITADITNNYPFRKFKIKSVRKEKEYVPLYVMRRIVNLELKNRFMRVARDYFMLSFYLCGMNPIDIWMCDKAEEDKIKFVRYKIRRTNPDMIHLELVDCAKEIVERYSGENKLLRFSETYASYSSFGVNLRRNIKRIGEMVGFPSLMYYHARYTWATYASMLGYDDNLIGKALGHADVLLVQSRYISFDWSRVWKMNREVVEYMLVENK